MCFYVEIDHKINSKQQIAKKDIICYKRLEMNERGHLTSPYQYMRYKLRQVYTIKNKSLRVATNTGGREIEIGFHSYTNITRLRRGLYNSRTDAIVECVIPKGSKYYINDLKEEYVSISIKARKILVNSGYRDRATKIKNKQPLRKSKAK